MKEREEGEGGGGTERGGGGRLGGSGQTKCKRPRVKVDVVDSHTNSTCSTTPLQQGKQSYTQRPRKQSLKLSVLY